MTLRVVLCKYDHLYYRFYNIDSIYIFIFIYFTFTFTFKLFFVDNLSFRNTGTCDLTCFQSNALLYIKSFFLLKTKVNIYNCLYRYIENCSVWMQTYFFNQFSTTRIECVWYWKFISQNLTFIS